MKLVIFLFEAKSANKPHHQIEHRKTWFDNWLQIYVHKSLVHIWQENKRTGISMDDHTNHGSVIPCFICDFDWRGLTCVNTVIAGDLWREHISHIKVRTQYSYSRRCQQSFQHWDSVRKFHPPRCLQPTLRGFAATLRFSDKKTDPPAPETKSQRNNFY